MAGETEIGNANARARATIQASACWARGKEIFLLSLLESKKPPQKAEIDEFMKDNAHLEGTIDDCKKIQNSADTSYKAKPSGRILGKLLDTLNLIKEVADPFLEFAPESVSIAWFAISTLIQIGAKDIESCELIFGACNNIATILLTCRIYENRYQDAPQDHGTGNELGNREVEQKIISGIPEIIAAILDFSWHVRLMFKKNKFIRALKEVISPKIKEKIDAIETGYANIRKFVNDAFSERIMDSVEDLRKSLRQDREELRSIMFPAIEEFREKLNDISNVKNTLELSKLREEFRQKRTDLRPSDTHSQQLDITFDPVSRYADHICQWLFTDPHFQLWELEDGESEVEKKERLYDEISKLQPASSKTTRIPNIFYIQARPGFGKSVTLASVIRRLSFNPDSIVCYFFFKQGDDATQKCIRALTSLATQLLDDKYGRSEDELMKLAAVLEQMRTAAMSAMEEGKDGANSVVFGLEMLKDTITNIGLALKRRVYLLVDAIDECIDHEADNLIPYLISLANIPYFRVMISSRESDDLENIFTGKSESTASEDEDGKIERSSSCLVTDKATILNITEERNSTDMQIFLRTSLQRIMAHRAVGKDSLSKIEEDTNRIVESIKQKANGMFTYAAIVIASLEQPSQLTLTQKLKNLPEGMDDLYRQRLEDLSFEEKKLVLIALKFIVWGFGNVSPVEIADQFKRVYDQDLEAPDIDDISSLAEKTESPIDPSGDRATVVSKSNEAPTVKYDPMSDPEIVETIYHLRKSGRDFLKFSENQTKVDVVHKTVRDWVQNEAEKIKKWHETAGATKPKLSVNEKGELNISLPIPRGLA
ncbi:hypothetical protein AA313_de0207818 [Arthrobotrys entomopaga]|nr:hypothetical protein AA313_de0207818 [Arthrobotrys entomopaga]